MDKIKLTNNEPRRENEVFFLCPLASLQNLEQLYPCLQWATFLYTLKRIFIKGVFLFRVFLSNLFPTKNRLTDKTVFYKRKIPWGITHPSLKSQRINSLLRQDI